MNADKAPQAEGMAYLESLPRRVVTLYIPLAIFLFVLLFPFYWMGITSFKPNNELVTRSGNPFWIVQPTLAHFEKLLFNTQYPAWMWNTVIISVVSTFASLAASVFAAYAIERRGCQEHSYTRHEFAERYRAAFGHELPAAAAGAASVA